MDQEKIATIEAKREPALLLVTGATGYVGSHLVPRLLDAGYRVRVLARDPSRLRNHPWSTRVHAVRGDALNPETLSSAMSGVAAAYYLIHSLSRADFAERDRNTARNFARAARSAGVRRIIYLGGLGDPEDDLSEHLRSRQQTGEILREAGVPVTEFRAAIIVGSGSLSFEMIRHLTERVPAMICPRWVFSRVQPIGIGDVLDYLAAALVTPESAGQIIEIGGTEVLTYGDMMMEYAEARGLPRRILPVPVLTPRLSSYWVYWVTPISAAVARALIEGLRNSVVVQPEKASQVFPGIRPAGYRHAVQQALERLHPDNLDVIGAPDQPAGAVHIVHEGMIVEQRRRTVDAPSDTVYRTFSELGGRRGWLHLNWLWRLRGTLDRMVGGIGFRQGRRDPDRVRLGDAVDFWRVEVVEPGRRIRLRAEIKLPGSAWLQFEAHPIGCDRTRMVQTAYFAPWGLLGLLYWHALYPIHRPIFAGMMRKLAPRAEASDTSDRCLEDQH